MNEQTEVLERDLEPEEIQERGDRLARITGELGDLEEQKRAAAKAIGLEIADLQAECRHCAREIRSRRESVEVAVYDERNEPELEIVTVRRDTGEIIRRRPMTQQEKQRTLFPIAADPPPDLDAEGR